MKRRYYIGFVFILSLSMLSCKKDYYVDSGIEDPRFDGSVMKYLEQDPFYFDTLVRVIKHAGLETTLQNETVTFFAPPDPCFDKIIKYVNEFQLERGRDSVTRFEQIKPAVWKKYLSMYIFPSNRGLRDYNQIDTLALDTYRGNLLETIDNQVMNVGVIFNDAVNNNGTSGDLTDDIILKYKGYRQLMLSYLYDYGGTAGVSWFNAPVATSDIAPDNGRVHILKYRQHTFGFFLSGLHNRQTKRG
ncbi:fasciclin domain-containing protein [Niabella ginsengisoli]|uniref:Fasciclin domain-containing protein n=1 Tax=Niabella ginsengisoli TaxID=522298 RepID=A0ABS9SIX7_9BACT|nr:fasciclin domain-containing protein [Niabella ginsengisoli]MCH5598305.1 fasciclin domain-containing protein [Niabella ginsengisoli]